MTNLADFEDRIWGTHFKNGPYSQPGSFDTVHDIEWTTLALCGETGELANEVKKIVRDDGALTTDRIERCISEAADVLVYLGVLAHLLGCPLAELFERAEVNRAAYERRVRT